jgi:hypothetical protein
VLRKSVGLNRRSHSRLWPAFLVMLLTTACATLSSTSVVQSQEPDSYVPPEGFVPDSTTALRVADAVLSAVYPERILAPQRPFAVKLVGDTWDVRGRLAGSGRPGYVLVGGVAMVRISKKDGRILHMSHSR